MPGATSSVLVTSSNGLQPNSDVLHPSKALVTRSDALVLSSFLLLVVMPGATFVASLLLVAISFVTNGNVPAGDPAAKGEGTFSAAAAAPGGRGNSKNAGSETL